MGKEEKDEDCCSEMKMRVLMKAMNPAAIGSYKNP
jgi:hypothetical protein